MQLDLLKEMLVPVIGSLGIFMLGLEFMADSINHLAANRMRALLARIAGTPVKGLFAGTLIRPYRRARAITRNKRSLFSLQSMTDSSCQALESNEALSPLVDPQPASACRTLKTAIVQGSRSSIVGAASQEGDGQSYSSPSMTSRRTCPPVGPCSHGCPAGAGLPSAPALAVFPRLGHQEIRDGVGQRDAAEPFDKEELPLGVHLEKDLCSAFIISLRRVRNFSPSFTGLHELHSPGH